MSSLDLDDFHSEQETTRLALMGDAVCIAASSIYFTVRLLDATVDLFFDYSTATNRSSTTYKAFLEFKKTEELGNLVFSLVYPLVFMRVFGSFKDMYFAFCKPGADETRLALDFSDFIIVSLSLMWSFGVIPALEEKVLVEEGGADLLRKSASFYDLEFAHLLGLAQAGLLALFSLLKMFARLERAAVRHKLFFLAAVAAAAAAAREDSSDEDEEEEEEEGEEHVVEDKQQVVAALVEQPAVLWKRVEVDEPLEKQAREEEEEEVEDEIEAAKIPLGVALAAGACTFVLTLKAL